MSVANHEVLVASAARRALKAGEKDAVPRVSDFESLAASTSGKLEVETLEERGDEQIVDRLVKSAVLTVFKERVPTTKIADVVLSFDDGVIVHAGDDLPSGDYLSVLEQVPALRGIVLELTDGVESPAVIASAVEFVLEGLHLSKRLNKEASGNRAVYRAR
jgi:magnesium chelatase subunit I